MIFCTFSFFDIDSHISVTVNFLSRFHLFFCDMKLLLALAQICIDCSTIKMLLLTLEPLEFNEGRARVIEVSKCMGEV